jgi:hypothetical protein
MERSRSDTELYKKPKKETKSKLVNELKRELSNLTSEEAEDIKQKTDDLLESFYKIYIEYVAQKYPKKEETMARYDTFKPGKQLEQIKPPKLTLKNAYKILKFVWKFAETPAQQIKRRQRELQRKETEMTLKMLASETDRNKHRQTLYGSGVLRKKPTSRKKSTSRKKPTSQKKPKSEKKPKKNTKKETKKEW